MARDVEVFRNDKVNIDILANFDGIVLSPGPGQPKDYPNLREIILELGIKTPVLGVCLGHQAIAESWGGRLFNMPEVWHGVARDTIIIDDDDIFKDIPKQFLSGRYHSWAVSEAEFPDCLKVTAKDEDGTIMALKHISFPINGIQFHPESILTPFGKKIMENWVKVI